MGWDRMVFVRYIHLYGVRSVDALASDEKGGRLEEEVKRIPGFCSDGFSRSVRSVRVHVVVHIGVVVVAVVVPVVGSPK